jgi:hypothetical protein
MAHTSKTTLLPRSANGWLGVRDHLGIVMEETDLIAIQLFFELLAEWESKEAKNAHLNQS